MLTKNLVLGLPAILTILFHVPLNFDVFIDGTLVPVAVAVDPEIVTDCPSVNTDKA